MVLLAKIPYLAFSHYCANHFMDIFTPCFRSSQDQLSCHFSEKSKEEFGQNDSVNIQTGSQASRQTVSPKKAQIHLQVTVRLTYRYTDIYLYIHIYVCVYCRLAAYIWNFQANVNMNTY